MLNTLLNTVKHNCSVNFFLPLFIKFHIDDVFTIIVELNMGTSSTHYLLPAVTRGSELQASGGLLGPES